MAVGDLVELGNVQEIDQLPVGGVQSALKAALADGHKLIELEVPTTNRFKDQPLNVILQYNTRYIRELVRCFTQPQEVCIVFPDKKECEYAVEDYGGDVPFYITPLDNPRVADLDVSVDKVFVMNPVFDVREYVNTEELWTQTVEPRGGAQIVVNGELFKLRQGGLMGYYPDFIFPKLAEARKRMMPKMVTAYYLRVFRGPPIGALYRSYPGPWQVLRAEETEEGAGFFRVLWEGDADAPATQPPPEQSFVLSTLQKSR